MVMISGDSALPIAGTKKEVSGIELSPPISLFISRALTHIFIKQYSNKISPLICTGEQICLSVPKKKRVLILVLSAVPSSIRIHAILHVLSVIFHSTKYDRDDFAISCKHTHQVLIPDTKIQHGFLE